MYEELITELTYRASIEKRKLLSDAADALEAAERRIAKLEAQLPKEAHWVAVDNGHGVCSNCNRQDSIDNMATHCRYCGAKMRGENDGET